MSELALQKVLHFTGYDLSMNQSGQISQSQQRWMLRGVYNSIALSFGVLLVLIILFHLFGRYNPLLLTVGGGVIMLGNNYPIWYFALLYKNSCRHSPKCN